MKLYQYLTFAVAIILVLSSCNEVPMNPENNATNLANSEIDATLKVVGNMRIFFGHQSVGKNILEGISDISAGADHKINIVESREVKAKDEAVFLHASIGKNKDPFSKIADFREIVENGISGKTDVAFFKFCYVDFDQMTDIQSIFQKYQETLQSLKESYPQIIFVHLTVPLVESSLNLKDYIKKIIGKSIPSQEGNITRCKFNTLLREKYEGKEPIFDLAKIESTYPDGKREVFKKSGSTFYALVPAYTYDGGHLNEAGRKLVAAKLLLLLASLNK
jgi:hypothetical protein